MKAGRIVKFSLIVFVVFLISVSVQFSGILSGIENKTYDGRIRQTSRFFKPSEDIAVVLVDQESITWVSEELGYGWPWPRSIWGEVVDFMNEGNAKSVAFDMVYTEPSIYGQKDDESFANADSEYGKVIHTVFYATHDENEKPVFPIDIIKNSAGMIGTIQSDMDEDGVCRRNRLYSTSIYKEPSLAIATLNLTNQEDLIDSIPVAKNGGMYIRFQKDFQRYTPYNVKQILQSKLILENDLSEDELEDVIMPEDFSDMYVFIGVSAPGLYDICANPVSGKYPGIGVHVCQLDTILNESYLKDLPSIFVILVILLLTVIGGFIGEFSVQGKVSSFLISVGILFSIMLVYILLVYGLFVAGLIVPVTVPVLAILLSYISFMAKNYLTEGRQRRYLKHAFGQYLSPKVIDNLIEHPEALKLGGERREISVYFSDVQGFTSISENLSPEELTELLNKYLSAMTDIILAHGGTIDKYEGDAIIAFWNAPTFQEDHALRALEAAMECQQKLKEMQNELKKAGKPVLQRIGLNTGYAVVGNMGSNLRFDYTMLGDTVNLASRLEGINKQFGTYTMCSKAMMESAMKYGCKFKFRELANIAVVGRKEGVQVFEPMKEEEYESRKDELQVFNNALSIFTNGDFSKAKTEFESIASVDPAAAKYIDKCTNLIENPPESWNGVIRATEK